MSAAKKAIKGVANAVKGVVKGVTHFVQKHWKAIVIAAAIVFTAGIATVGVAGFSSAMGAAGGGFGGFMSAAGSTFAAGASTLTGGAIGSTSAFGGTAAGSGATGVFAATPGTIGGTTASTLGAAAPTTTGIMASGAGTAATTLPGITVTAPAAAGAGNLASTAATVGGGSVASQIGNRASQQAVNDSTQQAVHDASKTAGDQFANTTPSGGFGNTMMKLLDTRAAGPVLGAGISGLASYANAASQKQIFDQSKPLSYWGAGARGVGGANNITSPWATGDTLTASPAPTSLDPTGVVKDPRTGLYVQDPRAQMMANNPGLMGALNPAAQSTGVTNGYS